MFKRNIIYTAIIALLLLTWGCDKLIFDQPSDDGGGAKVHLSVNLRAVEQGDTRSINIDGNYEDAVHDLAMIIFEPNGDNIYSSYFNNNVGSNNTATYVFSVELIASRTYDFYFIANMPDLQQSIDNGTILSRTELDEYLSDLSGLNATLYKGASKKGEGLAFPMARVYMNQNVPTGGTVNQPKPFLPQQKEGEYSTVVVNSAGDGEIEREYVELIRVVAKLEVEIPSTEYVAVAKVYYQNAFGKFSLNTQATPITGPIEDYFGGETELSKGADGKYWMYMPEALMPGNPTWDESIDNKPINYFVIEATNGTSHKIPIITYGTAGDPIPGGNYMTFAKGKYEEGNEVVKPNYDLYRNRRYVYRVKNITSQTIEVDYTIDPWKYVKTFLYMGYGYNVSISDGKVKIANTIDACPPHEVKLVAMNGTTLNGEVDGSFTFTNDDPTASQEYDIDNIPTTGEYLKVYYNDKLVKTFSN